MKLTEYGKLWYGGIFKPTEAIKRIQKEKPGTKEGLTSVVLLSLVIGVVFGTIGTFAGTEDVVMLWTSSLILIPILAAICLLLFAGIFRFVANNFKGKAKFDETVGFFGIYAGVIVVAMVPLAIFNAVAGAVADATFALLLVAIGTLGTAMLSGVASGLLYEVLSSIEKTKLPRTGLIYGTTTGLITVLLMVIVALLMPSLAAYMM
ncbi:MAG: YIP1 family protein [archaeon]